MFLRSSYALLGLLLLSACKRDPLPDLVHFAFVIPVSISPGADTVARGDTLWLTANFSDSLLDLRSNQRYRLRAQDIPLISSVGFNQLMGAGQFSRGAAPSFAVVNQVGQLRPGGPTFRRFEPVYDGQYYRARIGIIPQVSGIYALSLLSTLQDPFGPNRPLPFLQVSPDADGNPRRAILDDVYYVINNGNTHFALQQQNSYVTADQPGAPELSVYYERKGTFSFVVK